MSPALEVAKVGLVVFLAAILQVSIFAPIDVGEGSPNLVLVTVVAVALLRGAIFGAATGFFAGLLVDTATLETLGLTSLVLTTAGYWIGRYGETTGRDRAHAPLLSVVVVTVLYTVGLLALHVVLGDDVSARRAFVEGLVPAILFNALLIAPVYALCRRLVGTGESAVRAPEVRLLG